MRGGAKLLFSSGPRAGFIRISTNCRHFHRSLAKFDESADEESVTEARSLQLPHSSKRPFLLPSPNSFPFQSAEDLFFLAFTRR